jgi:hypothetical protein
MVAGAMGSTGTDAESHAFVLRVRLDPLPGMARGPALRIRLERVADHRVWHFDAIDPLIAELRSRLETIVRQSTI